jgi:hypothetical protein
LEAALDGTLSFIKRLAELIGFENLDLASVLFSLFLAIAVAFIISQIYKYTHRGLNYELAFMSTLVLLAPIVSVVMLFIRGDLVLSLGLIGSLSIIRFRTPIKDTRDMVFLFWVIAVGLGCGTYNWNVVIISTIVISITMFLLHFMKYGQSRGTDYVLIVTGSLALSNNQIGKVLKRYAKESRIRSQEAEEGFWEIIFEVQLIDLTQEKTGELFGEIKAIEGVSKVSLLAPQIALPV